MIPLPVYAFLLQLLKCLPINHTFLTSSTRLAAARNMVTRTERCLCLWDVDCMAGSLTSSVLKTSQCQKAQVLLTHRKSGEYFGFYPGKANLQAHPQLRQASYILHQPTILNLSLIHISEPTRRA